MLNAMVASWYPDNRWNGLGGGSVWDVVVRPSPGGLVPVPDRKAQWGLFWWGKGGVVGERASAVSGLLRSVTSQMGEIKTKCWDISEFL